MAGKRQASGATAAPIVEPSSATSTSTPPTRDAAFFAARGYAAPVGVDTAGWLSLSKWTFGWASPLIARGVAGGLDGVDAERAGEPFPPLAADPGATGVRVAAEYERAAAGPAGARRALHRALFRLYWPCLVSQLAWAAAEVASRLGSALALRALLTWLSAAEVGGRGGPAASPARGWGAAAGLAAAAAGYLITHHQLFYIGMSTGYSARMGVTTAMHAKVLRLNAATLARLGSGRAVTLASADARRLDDASVYWPFIIAAPVELCFVFGLLAARLGPGPAAAGVCSLALLVAGQAFLARFIGRLRTATAIGTDARVRTLSEAISGALAVKMLSWEPTLLRKIRAARAREARHATVTALIRGAGQGLFFLVHPLSCFCLFATVYGLASRAGGTSASASASASASTSPLSVADVFYAIALLRLPQLYVAIFFVKAVEVIAELGASLARLDAFLGLPEPPRPPHARWAEAAAGGRPPGAGPPPPAEDGYPADDPALPPGTALAFRGAAFDWEADAADAAAVIAASGGEVAGGAGGAGGEDPSGRPARERGEVAMSLPGVASPPRPSTDGRRASASLDLGLGATPPLGPTLAPLTLTIPAGQLVGITGEVGSGKSSLLAALLAELAPRAGWDGGAANPTLPLGRRVGAVTPGLAPVVRAASLAYCAQVPAIVAGSVRDNVVFGTASGGGDGDGEAALSSRLASALAAADLTSDLAALPAGLETEIGERGINLSGGQRARVALARAVFAGADVVLLDDPLSALDARVAGRVFDACLDSSTGALASSTRLLVTHARQFLPRCDRVVILRGGVVAHDGPPASLAAAGVPELLQQGDGGGHGGGADEVDAVADEADAEEKRGAAPPPPVLLDASLAPSAAPPPPAGRGGLGDALRQDLSVMMMGGDAPPPPAQATPRTGQPHLIASLSRAFGSLRLGKAPAVGPPPRRRRRRGTGAWRPPQGWPAPGTGGEAAKASDNALTSTSGRLTVAEGRVVGGVGRRVWLAWAGAIGWPAVGAVSAALILGQAAYLFSEWWVSALSGSGQAAPSPTAPRPPLTATAFGASIPGRTWLLVYGAVTASIVVLAMARSLLFFGTAMAAATRLHEAAAAAVLRAPLAFFHANPAGRILNKFTKDQGILDDYLPGVVSDAAVSLLIVAGAFVLCAVAVPAVLLLFIPLAAAFAVINRRYLTTSREVKRQEAVTRSPVYAALAEAPPALPTLRAYGSAAPAAHAAFVASSRTNGGWAFSFIAAARWIGFRLDSIATAVIIAEAALIVGLHARVPARLAGLALSQAVALSGSMQWAVRQASEAEVSMTSAERVCELGGLPQEPLTLALGGPPAPPGWPGPGGAGVAFDRVTAAYRPGLPPVLQDVSFTLPPGSSAGLCGRTGSGKSSLLLALFRLIPVTAGTVSVGGVDVSTLALDVLRRQVAVIPQNPTLFSGSVRSNLDPTRLSPDAALWAALKSARLAGAVRALPGGLDAPIAEGGANLSVGQRQLLCLARALLADAGVLALDEATANIDAGSDAAIQGALRAAGADRPRTLLIIAHRLSTVMECDAVMVLAGGRLVESGAPAVLAAKGEASAFGRLVGAAARARRG